MGEQVHGLKARARPASSRPRIALGFLGCRVNHEELECLASRFVDEGFERVPFEAEAEVHVINTCTVTGVADADSRKTIRRAVRRKVPGGLVVVTGCYAQRDPEVLRELDGVDLVLGNTEKSELFEHVESFRRDRRIAGDLWVSDVPATTRFLRHGRTRGEERTRATLKVQDGCDERCTYCIIPKVRGVSVSRDSGEVLAEARHLAGLGYREIALTGVNTGCYGHDLGDRRGLARLVRNLDGLDLGLRFRLNSLEPATVTGELLDAVEECPSFCRYFHVPLQHGDSRMLRRMGRSYDAQFYEDVVSRIHERFPGAGLGADVMTGFPGESDEHFERGLAFVATLPISYLHVFSYSERQGTPAARMPAQVDPAAKRERSSRLRELDALHRAAFAERWLDLEDLVLTESKRGPGGGVTGLTGSYLRVELAANGEIRPDEFWRVRIGPLRRPGLLSAIPLGRQDALRY